MKLLLRKILPHAAIVLGGMVVVFYVIDRFNTAMGFINNGITKALLLAFCAVSVVNARTLISGAKKRRMLWRRILSYAATILSGTYAALFVIDCLNGQMSVINHEITKALLLAFCLIGMVNAGVVISDDRKRARRAAKKARKKKAARV